MKRLILTTFILLGAFTSCKKPTPPAPPPPTPTLEVSTETLFFTSEGGQNDLEIISNGDWTISGADATLIVSPAKGNGDLTVKVIMLANTIEDDITKTLIVKSGTLEKTVTVKQTAKGKLTLEVSTEALDFVTETSQTFDITSDSDWIISGATETVKVTPKNGKGDATITVEVTPNTTDKNIVTILTVKMGEIKKTVTVTQIVKEPTILEVSTEALDFVTETSRTFDITSDGGWIISGATETVKVTPKNGKGDATITVEVTPNTTNKNIVTILTVQMGEIKKTVTITQIVKEQTILEVSTKALAFVTETSGIFDIISDGDWIISGATETVKVTPTNGKGDATITVEVTPKTADENIVTILTVQMGEIKKTVTVTQIVKSDIHVNPAGSLAGILAANPDLAAAPKLRITGVMNADDFAALKASTNSTLKHLDIRDLGITALPFKAFHECYILETISLPDELTEIGTNAFYDCSTLTSIAIPDKVTTIEGHSFFYCSALKNVTFGANSQLSIIGDHAFRECQELTSIAIPDKVTKIGKLGFSGCEALKNVTFGANSQLSIIGDYAFFGCSTLTSINIPDKVTTIGIQSLSGCVALKNVIFGANSQLSTIGNNTFRNCFALTSINIPDKVTTIGGGAFFGCSALTSVTFGANSQLSTIGSQIFRNCSALTNITIPGKVTSIEEYAFSGCSALKNVTFGANSQLTGIENSTFRGCSSLTNITLPYKITKIGDEGFYGCSALTSITIPDKVTSIGGYAFRDCSALNSIICLAITPPNFPIYNDSFYGTPATKILKVPGVSVNSYQNTTAWAYCFSADKISGI